MLKKELLEKIKDLDDNANVDELLDFAKSNNNFDVNKVTLDDYKNMLANNQEIKGYYTSTVDSKVSRSIETWKKNNLNKIIEEEIKKRDNSNLTPEQAQIKELQEKLNNMEQEKTKQELLNTNRTKLKEKGLSEDLAKYVNTDEDIEFFNTLINDSVSKGVKEKINNASYEPPQTDTSIKTMDGVEQAFYNRTGIKL